jgi:hypothetical protein
MLMLDCFAFARNDARVNARIDEGLLEVTVQAGYCGAPPISRAPRWKVR